MPRIVQGKEKGKIIFDATDFLSGLHPQFTSSTLNSQINIGDRLTSVKNFDPYRHLGYAAPGQLPTSVATTAQIDTLITDGLMYNQNAYLLTTGKLLKLTSITSTPDLSTTSPFPYTITAHSGHSSVVGKSIVQYGHKLSVLLARRLLYVWADNTDWDVGTYDFDTTFDDDFMTTVALGDQSGTVTTNGTTTLAGSGTLFTQIFEPGDTIYVSGETVRVIAAVASDTSLTVTSAFSTSTGSLTFKSFPSAGKSYPKPTIVGINDRVYIGDRNYVHEYNGQSTAANGTFSPKVLKIPAGYVITCFAKYQNYLVVFAYIESGTSAGTTYFNGDARAFFWSYNSRDIAFSVGLDDNYVGCAVEYNGTIACFTQGRTADPTTSNNSKLQIFNGQQFDVVATFTGNVPIPAGAEALGRYLQWNSAGKIYTYGSPFSGVQAALNQTITNAGGGTSSGILKTLSTSFQVMSAGTTTSGGLEYINFGATKYTSSAWVVSGLAFPDFGTRQKGQVERVTIRFQKAATGGRSLTLSVLDGFANSTTIVSALTAVTSPDATLFYEFASNGGYLPQFNAIKCLAEWESGSAATDAPIIQSVTIEYKIVDISP